MNQITPSSYKSDYLTMRHYHHKIGSGTWDASGQLVVTFLYFVVQNCTSSSTVICLL